MNEQNTKSRREFLSRGLTAFAYAAPVVAALAVDREAQAAEARVSSMGMGKMPRPMMNGMGMGHGGHG